MRQFISSASFDILVQDDSVDIALSNTKGIPADESVIATNEGGNNKEKEM